MATLFCRSCLIVASLLLLSCESPPVVVEQAEPVVRKPSALFLVDMADALLGDWRDRHFETMDRMGLEIEEAASD